MKRRYLLPSETKNLKKRQDKIILIGWLILAILLLLSGCSRQIEYVYVEPERVPITCIDSIKTPLDMAKCLSEYKERY